MEEPQVIMRKFKKMRFKIQLKGHSGKSLIDLFLSLAFCTDGKVTTTKINELYFKVGVKDPGNLGDSHITLQPKTGCPLKLSRVEPGQYLDGRPPGGHGKTRLLLKRC